MKRSTRPLTGGVRKKHRSHVSASRYTKRQGFGDIIACKAFHEARRLGLRPIRQF